MCDKDIDIAHRLGRYSRDKPRGVIVKLVHRSKKHEIVRARRKLKGTRYTVFEDLTKVNQECLRQAYKLKCVKNSYSVDRKLYVVLNNDKKRRLLHDVPIDEAFLMNDANFHHRSR